MARCAVPLSSNCASMLLPIANPVERGQPDTTYWGSLCSVCMRASWPRVELPAFDRKCTTSELSFSSLPHVCCPFQDDLGETPQTPPLLQPPGDLGSGKAPVKTFAFDSNKLLSRQLFMTHLTQKRRGEPRSKGHHCQENRNGGYGWPEAPRVALTRLH